MRQLAYESPTGARLNVNYQEPSGKSPPKAIIQINHGLAEHSARYEGFMQRLAQGGYGAIAHDHRGHGLTTAPDAPQGQFARANGFRQVLGDVGAIHDWAGEHWPDVPLVCFGHSMGALIAFSYALRNPGAIQALALWNMSFDAGMALSGLRGLLVWERWQKGSDVPSFLANKLTFDTWNSKFKPNRTPFDWLSRDPEEVDKYIADPLCGFPATTGLWLDVLDAIEYCANDNHLLDLPRSLPTHIQAGSKDPCTENGKAIKRLNDRLLKNRQTDVTLNIIDGARHESLNETNRDETMTDFIAWLDAHFGVRQK